MAGRQEPKVDFYKKWKDTFGEDLMDETFVSAWKHGNSQLSDKERLIRSLEGQVDFLQWITKSSLATILESVIKTKDTVLLNRAYLEAGLHWEAMKEAGEDEEKKASTLDTLNRLVVGHLSEDSEKDKRVPLSKR
jgi:hypothetical protein